MKKKKKKKKFPEGYGHVLKNQDGTPQLRIGTNNPPEKTSKIFYELGQHSASPVNKGKGFFRYHRQRHKTGGGGKG